MALQKFLLPAAAIMFASSAALASLTTISVSKIEGQVLIDRGEGLEPAIDMMPLIPGNRLVLGLDGRAVVSHGDCKILLSETSVYTVADVAPCGVGEAFFVQDGSIVQQAADMVVDPPPPPADFKPAIVPYAAGGAAAIVGVGTFATAVAFTVVSTVLDEDEDPVSP